MLFLATPPPRHIPTCFPGAPPPSPPPKKKKQEKTKTPAAAAGHTAAGSHTAAEAGSLRIWRAREVPGWGSRGQGFKNQALLGLALGFRL